MDNGLERDCRGEARSWVVRLASGKMTAGEATTFRRWHSGDPACQRAFAEAKQQWTLIGQAANELARDADVVATHGLATRAMSRRWMMGAAAAAGIGVIAVRPPYGLWTPLLDFAADYHTGIGETRTLAMGENVTVQLSTRSRLSIQSDRPEELRMSLLGGEAAVVSEARSVTVTAGNGEVRALSGRFNLRNDDGDVRVTCLGGLIDVQCDERRVVLQVDQQTRYGDGGLAQPMAVQSEDVTAWQRGILVFRDRKLRDVIDEINRYRVGAIILLNPDLGKRPVALASFHLDHLDEVISQVEALYGAKSRRLPGGIVLLS